MKTKILLITLIFTLLNAKNCLLPKFIKNLTLKNGVNNLSYITDVKRNYNSLKKLCTTLIGFKEGNLDWKMLLVTNPAKEHGLFWFLPHDNENSAFDSAVWAVKRYGGGFLSIVNGNRRYNNGQDPNRNFSYAKYRICKEQLFPSPIYTYTVFSIIDYYKYPNFPYLALHNNIDGGTVSILKSSAKVKSYLAYPRRQIIRGKALQDEDNLIYMAGLQSTPPSIINRILKSGMSVKYEIVNSVNNDCSMSNFVVLEKRTDNYFNIETQNGQSWVQKEMIKRLIKIIGN